MRAIKFKKSLAMGAAVIFGLGYLIGLQVHHIQTGHAKAQKIKLKEQQSIIDGLRIQLGVQNTQINTLNVATQQLEETIRLLEKNNKALDRDLVFYKNIMEPSSRETRIDVDSFTLEPLLSEHRYRYQVVLTQKSNKHRVNHGHVDFQIEGSQNGQKKTLHASDLGLSSKDKNYAFKYFQVLEGDWTLPSDFIPDIIRIKVVSKRYPTVEHNISWSEMIAQNDSSS